MRLTAIRSAAQRHRRRPGRARGQALVEFALLSVVMLTLLAGAIDLGRIFYATITISNAARTGALQAGRTPGAYTMSGGTLQDCPTSASTYDDNLVVCAVQNETRSSFVRIPASRIQIACETFAGSPTACQAQPVADVRSRVTVSATFSPLTPLIAAITGNTITMTSSAVADQLSLPTAVLPPDLSASPTPPTASPTATPSSSPTPPSLVAGFAVTSPRCKGSAIGFTDTSSGGPNRWSWTFGDGGTSTSTDPRYTYASAGTYTIKMTVTRDSDGATDTASLAVTVGAPPSAAFTPPSGTTVAAGSIVQFADMSIANPNVTSWGWNFGDNGAGNTSSAQNPTHKYTGNNKTYTVTLTTTNACGSSSTTGTIKTN